MKKLAIISLIALILNGFFWLATIAFASQNSLIVPDGTGASVRAGFNDAIDTLNTINSGPSAPTTTEAYMLWADTTNGLLKQRDAANATWIVLGTLGATNLGLQPAFTSQIANYFYAAPNGSAGVPSFRAIVPADIPTLNQNTSGTAANLSGTPSLPNGATATTQTAGDNSTKLATTAYVATAVSGSGGGQGIPHGMQLFTSSGTWTLPSGITKAWVICVGGGGGSGGSGTGTPGPGGPGGYAEGIIAVTGNVTVTVGGGGAGNLSGNGNGNGGGTSSFAGFTTISASGGGGGNASGGYGSSGSGSGGSVNTCLGAPYLGGAGTGGSNGGNGTGGAVLVTW
ncbi:MAG: hypothetical protein ACLQED_09230 [Desulfobaccales bacterium]|jgi:hypothetical protein